MFLGEIRPGVGRDELPSEIGPRQAVELVKLKTWQFARRQMTPFRNQLPDRWSDIAPDESARRIAEQIIAGG